MKLILAILSLVALTNAQGIPHAASDEPMPIGAIPTLIKEEPVDASTTPAPPPNATYWLSMSKKLRPGNPFRFYGEILKGDKPVTVQFTFMDSKGENTILEPAPITMQAGGIQTFDIEVPLDIKAPFENEGHYWGPRSYQVLVTGQGEMVNFKHKTQVEYEEKIFSTFIQTDKGMYKPGQKVHFRVLTVFPDMTAVRGEPYDIYIEDANENRIKQWLGKQDPNGRGVLELSLQLADQIPTGDWSIHANIMGKEEIKTFTVDNYVLPRFEVEIIAPAFGLTYQAMLNLKVKASYTFGQPVTDGGASIAIRGNFWGDKDQNPMVLRAPLNKDGIADFEVSTRQLVEHLKETRSWITSLSQVGLSIEAEVVEASTNRVQSATDPVVLRYHDEEMKIRFVDEVAPETFKPGLSYLIYAEVTKQDGSLFDHPNDINVYFNVTYEVPLSDEEKEEWKKKITEEAVKRAEEAAALAGLEEVLMPSFAEDESLFNYDWIPYRTKTVMLKLPYEQRVQKLPANGWVPLTFDIPKEATSVSVKTWVQSRDSSRDPDRQISWSKWLKRARSPSDSFLQLQVGTDKPTVGQEFAVTVLSTENITDVTYQMYAKGVMLESKVVQAQNGPQSRIDFSFMVTRDMAPSISLVAFYLRDENKEVVVDALSLSTNGLFDKQVKIAYSQDTAEPGEKIEVIVKAETDSTVYLLSADKSTLILKGGNDITQEDVTEEMAEYTVGSGFGGWRLMFICGWPSPYSGTTAFDTLNSAGVLFLSDFLVYQEQPDNRRRFFASAMADGSPGPVAMEAMPKGGANGLQAVDVVRKFFPEVWLWQSVDVTKNSGGQVSIPVTVPDTLTSWMTTGFSLHPEFGLSVAEAPTVLVVSRDLFVTLDLPMSLIRGEDYCFTATVFSYYKSTLPILVTLKRSDKFVTSHVILDGNTIRVDKESVNYAQFMDINENEIIPVKYCFSPLVTGEIPVRVEVLTNITGLSDAVERIVVCKPEGVPRATSYAYIADMSSTGQWSKNLDIVIPNNTVDGSHSLTVYTSGNFLSSMFDDLEGLLKRPYGCGEQNMLNFAPNIFLIEFYKATDDLPPDVKKKAITYMNDGYQRQNTYRHKNGGYSTFGSMESTDPASTWLTAFVVKCYALAQQLYLTDSDMVAIDGKIVAKAVVFLSTTQQKDGSFMEEGKIFNKAMQGASAEKGVSLTAYTLIALHEAVEAFQNATVMDQKMEEFIAPIMTSATRYLEERLSKLSDPYDICVVTYALSLVGSPMSETAFALMENSAIMDGNIKYWERAAPTVKPKSAWSTNTDSINIEMTAYALLVYSLRPGATSAGLPVLQWLTQNKGPNAGFYSTQDTIIGLQALSRVGSALYTGEDIPVTVTVGYEDEAGAMVDHEFKLDKSNELLLQSVQVPVVSLTSIPLTIKAQTVNQQSGPTTAIVEATLRYNVLGTETSPLFIVAHRVAVKPNNQGFDLSMSIRAPSGQSRSMSVAEIELPPGVFVDLEKLREYRTISRVELKGDVLALYFDTDIINERGVRFIIDATGTNSGMLTKPMDRSIKVYDYYNPSDEVTLVYTLKPIVDSEFCDALPDVGACGIHQLRQENLVD